MARARMQFWLLLALGFLLLGAILWTANKSNQKLPPAKTLSDGETVRVIKVLYSDRVTTPVDNPLVQILPSEISRRLHLHASTLALGQTNVIIAVETHRSHGTFFIVRPIMSLNLSTGIFMTNEVGDAFQLNGAIMQYHPRGETNTIVEIFTVPLVSSLATHLHLHLLHRDTYPKLQTTTADFDVPNPVPRSKLLWNAPQLPLTNHLGTLDIVLESIKPGERKEWGADYTNFLPFSTPDLKFFENGVQTTNWHLIWTSITDQFGHKFESANGHFSPLETRKWTFDIQHRLPIPPENIITFHEVPIMKSDETLSDVSTNFHGSAIRVVRLNRGQVEYHITPAVKDCVVKVSITSNDETAHHQTILDMLGGYNSGGNIGFGPPIAAKAKTVEITFTFVPIETRKVEFLAHP